MWAADGHSVAKKDEEETEGTSARNARSQAPKERGKAGRGRVTGRKDEL